MKTSAEKIPEPRSMRTRSTFSPDFPAMKSTGMPKRAVNLGMTSFRISGCGEPTTTTLPSRLAAASVASQDFCQSALCARPAQTRPRSIGNATALLMALSARAPRHVARMAALKSHRRPRFLPARARHPQAQPPADQHHGTDDRRDQQPQCRGALDLAGEAVFKEQDGEGPRVGAVEQDRSADAGERGAEVQHRDGGGHRRHQWEQDPQISVPPRSTGDTRRLLEVAAE